MIKYSEMLYNGDGIEMKKKEAAQYYKNAAENGNSYGVYNYGEMLYYGEGIDVDKKAAANYFEIAVKKKNTYGMIKLGEILYNGDGIRVDRKKAADYFNYAYFNDYNDYDYKEEFGYKLQIQAHLFFKGESEADMKKVALHWKIPSKRTDSDELFNYGQMLYRGDGINIACIKN